MISNILKGIIIGIANIIPGVSGGTMAVSMGIYDKIINAVTHLFKKPKDSIKTLFPYVVGAGIGIVMLSFLIEIMFSKFPLETNFLFIGLIVGGLPGIVKNVKGVKIKPQHIIAFVLFFAVVIICAALGDNKGRNVELSISFINMMKLFVVGLIASATMVIPGVSGSMILMLMGYYTPIIEEINNFIKGALQLDFNVIYRGIFILGPFGIGVIAGIFAIAKIIEIIFKKFPYVAYYGIIGLIVSSPFGIIMMNSNVKIVPSAVVISIITLIIGALIASKLGGEEAI